MLPGLASGLGAQASQVTATTGMCYHTRLKHRMATRDIVPLCFKTGAVPMPQDPFPYLYLWWHSVRAPAMVTWKSKVQPEMLASFFDSFLCAW